MRGFIIKDHHNLNGSSKMLAKLETIYFETLRSIVAARKRVFSKLDEEVAWSVYTAGLLGLEDHGRGIAQYRVVSAPTGSGKSTCAQAFIKAYLETFPNPSVLFLVETIDQAEDLFHSMSNLMKKKVAVWTSAHDRKKPHEAIHDAYGWVPKYRFSVDELENYPVVIATHQFYKGSRGKKASVYKGKERPLVFIDEKITDVAIYDVDTGLVKTVRDRIAEKYSAHLQHVEHLTMLHDHLEAYWASAQGKLAYDELGTRFDLSWFFADEVNDFIVSSDEDLRNVFGFGRALARGFAFMSRYDDSGKGARFVGYEMTVPLRPGSVLLDATADIDGVSLIANNRKPVRVPRVNFSNLTIHHLTSPLVKQKKRLSDVLRSPTTARPYAEWIKKTIIDHSQENEFVLAVVHKGLLDRGYLPDEASETHSAFNLESRKVCFINWGYGIGSNRWKDASSVYLFGEFHVPRRATIGTLLGIKEKPATKAELSSLQSPNTQDEHFLALKEGHLRRWEKQLAMRGNARNLTEDGVCGVQKLFVTAEFSRFLKYKDELFPGAKVTIEEDRDRLSSGGEKALVALLRTEESIELTSLQIKERTGIDLQKNRKRYLGLPLVQQAMTEKGWKFTPGGGRGKPSKFARQKSKGDD